MFGFVLGLGLGVLLGINYKKIREFLKKTLEGLKEGFGG